MKITLNITEEKYDEERGKECLNKDIWQDKEDEDGKGSDEQC